MKVEKIGLLGYGTVGYGVADVIDANANTMAKKYGFSLQVKAICDIADFSGDKREDLIVKDFDLLVSDPEISLIVECIGGLKPAYPFVQKALMAGKSVVTSNKELIATYGYELMQLAKQNGCKLLFEASVGGGTPLLTPIYKSLAANNITSVYGILNGTTNFILSKMKNEHMSFDDALKLAQQLGYAETIDPSADTEGHDACRKICILAGLCFGKGVNPQWVPTTGITRLSLLDINAAHAMDGEIKLIGGAELGENGINIFVEPAFVPHSNQLSHVEEAFNGMAVTGDMVGQVFFYGQGAGKLPTASAVVADVLAALNGDTPDLVWEAPDMANMAISDVADYFVVADSLPEGVTFDGGMCALYKNVSRKVLQASLSGYDIFSILRAV